MPLTAGGAKSNGYTNGCNGNGNGTQYDLEDGQTFLFTSESVGEGHPGELNQRHLFLVDMVFF